MVPVYDILINIMKFYLWAKDYMLYKFMNINISKIINFNYKLLLLQFELVFILMLVY